MHQIIYCVVPAKSQAEAVGKGKLIFEGLVGEGKGFDYYTTFDTNGTLASGATRWGQLPMALPLSSAEGSEMLRSALEAMWEEFKRNMGKVRRVVKAYTDREIFNERPRVSTPKAKLEKANEDLSSVRFHFKEIGEYSGSSCRVYDKEGSAIRNERDLEWMLNNYNEALPNGEELYIVPADVHF